MTVIEWWIDGDLFVYLIIHATLLTQRVLQLHWIGTLRLLLLPLQRKHIDSHLFPTTPTVWVSAQWGKSIFFLTGTSVKSREQLNSAAVHIYLPLSIMLFWFSKRHQCTGHELWASSILFSIYSDPRVVTFSQSKKIWKTQPIIIRKMPLLCVIYKSVFFFHWTSDTLLGK